MDNTVTADLPAYTAEEEKLVIRNKDGVPVGVKPDNSWTLPKIALWISITTMGTLGWTMLALVRGEEVNTIWFVITAVCTYAIAYRFYALYVQRKVMRPDDSNATPAERINNGKDFDPTHRVVLYGHHFAAIAGAARSSARSWPPRWDTFRERCGSSSACASPGRSRTCSCSSSPCGEAGAL